MLFFQKHSKDQTEAQKWKNDMDLLFISDAVILTNFLYLQELILRKEKKKKKEINLAIYPSSVSIFIMNL